MTLDNIDKNRLDLLRKELNLAGVSGQHLFPGWARSKKSREHIINELLAALEPSVHEGLIPPYGAIIAPEDTNFSSLLPLSKEALELARKAADGSGALLAWKDHSFAGLMFLQPTDSPELQLVQLAQPLGAVAIRRERGGAVRLYTPSRNLKHVARRWTVSLPVGDAVERILHAVPMADRSILVALLEFAFYVLSPWGIGATLVWVLSDRKCDQINVDLRPLKLNIQPSPSEASLGFTAHFLAQYDGATFLSRDGQLVTTGVHLMPSGKANELIPPLPGTRHTSARRASYDLADALVVTVSADGPVTVFSDGVSIFELVWYSARDEAAVMRREFGAAVKDSLWIDTRERQCPTCGKTSEIEVFTVAGWREHEVASCPVCKSELDSDHCFSIHANIKKVF